MNRQNDWSWDEDIKPLTRKESLAIIITIVGGFILFNCFLLLGAYCIGKILNVF